MEDPDPAFAAAAMDDLDDLEALEARDDPDARREERRRERGDRDRSDRDRDRDRERRRSDRDRSDRDRHRSDRDRSDKDRSDKDRSERKRDRHRSRSPARESRRRSRSREHRSSRRSSRSPAHDVAPLHLRPRRLANWDVPPPGMESMTALQVKSTGLFPIPSQLLRVPSQLGGPPPSHLDQPPEPLPMPTQTQPFARKQYRSGNEGGYKNGNNYPSNNSARDFLIRDGGMAGARDYPPPRLNMSSMHSQPPQAPQKQQQQLDNRKSKRLYVGNVPPDATEESMLAFINRCFDQLDVQREPGNAATVSHVNPERGYAFVEFRSLEETVYALSFDGVKLNGRTLRIRRPKDYVPDPNEPVIEQLPNISALLSVESNEKIYVGCIPSYLNEEQVQELLRTFGELKSFSLVRDMNTGISKGFAFCEYVDGSVTDMACSGLNGMELGEKKLVVQRAAVGSSRQNTATAGSGQVSAATSATTAGVPSARLISFPPAGLAGSDTPLNPSFVPPEIASVAANAAMVPTRILLLLNMVTVEDLTSNSDYEDILVDVKDECAKFGIVLDIWIPRPVNGRDAPGVGKIFVKYETLDEASSAQRALAGRKFAERTVVATFYDEEKFDKKEV